MNLARLGSRWRGAVLCLCLGGLLGCAYELVRNGSVNQSKAARIEEQIQDLRTLRFKQPVPLSVETRDQAEQDLLADLGRDFTDEQLRIYGQAGVLIGLYPEGIDLKATTIKLLKGQLAGFYDPHRKQMVLVEGSANLGLWSNTAEFVMQRDVIGEMLLGHELTHALQDQNFGLEAAMDAVKNNDDRSLALKSVAEGDATLAGFGLTSGKMDVATADLVISRLSDLPQAFAAQTAGAPEALSAPMIFQYSEGVRFVGEAYRRGGWNAVNALYASPPQSSQQIAKPALYFDHPTLPADIRLAGYQQLLPGWINADDNTLGQLLLGVILKRSLGDKAPQVRLAENWAGDRMITMRNGNALTIIWYLVFADDLGAEQFAAAYTTVLDSLLTRETTHRVDYRGNAVLVLIGESARHFTRMAPAIWQATQVVRPTPPPAVPNRAQTAAPSIALLH